MLWLSGHFQNVVRMIATPEQGRLSARLVSSTMFSEFEGDWTVCLLVALSCVHRLPYLLPPLSKLIANVMDLHDDLLACTLPRHPSVQSICCPFRPRQPSDAHIAQLQLSSVLPALVLLRRPPVAGDAREGWQVNSSAQVNCET